MIIDLISATKEGREVIVLSPSFSLLLLSLTLFVYLIETITLDLFQL